MKNYNCKSDEQGFTMIEMMITMVIALVIMGGMSGLFVSQTRTAQVLNSKSEVLNDLFLASQIMQFELRGAKAICWHPGTKRIRYQPLSSPNDTPAEVTANKLTSSCTKNSSKNGVFQIKPKGSKPSPYICWDRPSLAGNCQELIRGMKPYVSITDFGMTINPTGNSDLQTVRTVKLTAQYEDKEHNMRDLSLSFKVWPRNTQ